VNKGQQWDPYKLAVIDRWPLLASVTRWGLHILKCVKYFSYKKSTKVRLLVNTSHNDTMFMKKKSSFVEISK